MSKVRQDNGTNPSNDLKYWLEEYITNHPSGTQIPSGRQLAEEWGISEPTIRRTLQIFVDKNQIVKIPGKGSFVGSLPVGLPIGPALQSHEILTRKFRKMIEEGQLKIGQPLPSVKWTASVHHVTFTTVRKAYLALETMGLVSRLGKSFYAGSRLPGQSRYNQNPVYLFHANDQFNRILQNNQISSAFFQMEKELIANGFILKFGKWKEWNSIYAHNPAGILFVCPKKGQYQSLLPELKQEMYRKKTTSIRILIVTEASPPKPSKIALLNTGNLSTIVARSVVNLCIEKKHKNLTVFFDPLFKSHLSIFALLKIRTELKRVNPVTNFRIAFLGKKSEKKAFIQKLLRTHLPQTWNWVTGKYEATSPEEIFREIIPVSSYKDATQFCKSGMWVFRSDVEAIEMKSVCDQIGIIIPRDYTLISLENNPQWLTHGISSCIPDWNTMGYLMAHSLIGDIQVGKTARGYLRIPALMLPRLTS